MSKPIFWMQRKSVGTECSCFVDQKICLPISKQGIILRQLNRIFNAACFPSPKHGYVLSFRKETFESVGVSAACVVRTVIRRYSRMAFTNAGPEIARHRHTRASEQAWLLFRKRHTTKGAKRSSVRLVMSENIAGETTSERASGRMRHDDGKRNSNARNASARVDDDVIVKKGGWWFPRRKSR